MKIYDHNEMHIGEVSLVVSKFAGSPVHYSLRLLDRQPRLYKTMDEVMVAVQRYIASKKYTPLR